MEQQVLQVESQTLSCTICRMYAHYGVVCMLCKPLLARLMCDCQIARGLDPLVVRPWTPRFC